MKGNNLEKVEPDPATGEKVESVLGRMTLEEKVGLWAGVSRFEVGGVERLDIPRLKMTDGPQGVRGLASTAFPSGLAMAASWNEKLMEQVGAALGRETRAAGCGMLLGLGVNIMRTPLCGRNFEYSGEDPFLAGKIAAAYIRGLQSENIAASVKHLVCNNQEVCRTYSDSEVGERALREIYLPAFRIACKEGHSWTIMSSYNRVNGAFASSNRHIQQEIPKDEWGWDGAVVSDWNAVHEWIGSVHGGLDIIMPGPADQFCDALLSAIREGGVQESVVDEHARRTLRLIYRTEKAKGSAANTKEHRALCRELAHESITLLKNEQILPLSADTLESVAVIGPNANKQHCMDGLLGSGGSGAVHPPYETTPLEGLQNLVGEKVAINFAEGYAFAGGEMVIVPARYLRSEGQQGLAGVYYSSLDLTGEALHERLDKTINFRWTTQALDELPCNNFSSRWNGELVAPVSGEYIIGIESNGGSRLFFDGCEIIDNWKNRSKTRKVASVKMEAGTVYPLCLEYFDGGDDEALLRLIWKMPELPVDPLTAAVAAAKESDVAVVFAGLNHSYDKEGIGLGYVPGADRPDLELIDPQVELINAVAEANANTIVVLIGSGPVSVEQWHENVKGILAGWYPGQEGGHALADVLFGEANPSGKLPFTWGCDLNDWACHANGNYPGVVNGPVRYDEGIWVGYRHFEKEGIVPRFPFGHGLSYTSFKVDQLNVVQDDEVFMATCRIRNIGDRAGSEVIQLYISDEKASVERPVKELKGFKKVYLQPGEFMRVEFAITREDLSFYDVSSKGWKAEPGEFKAYVGTSSADIAEIETFRLEC